MACGLDLFFDKVTKSCEGVATGVCRDDYPFKNNNRPTVEQVLPLCETCIQP